MTKRKNRKGEILLQVVVKQRRGTIETYLAAGGGIVVLLLALFILTRPIKAGLKLLTNSISGLILLWLTNFIGGFVGFQLPYTIVTVLVSGVFGVPGVIALLFFRYFLGM